MIVNFRRQMWDNISVMHNPVDGIQFLFKVQRERMIAHPWATKIVHFNGDTREFMYKFDSVDKCQSGTEAMTSAHNSRHLIKSNNSLCSCEQFLLIQSVVRHESGVHKTPFAWSIRLHLEVKILDPILDIVAAPPC